MRIIFALVAALLLLSGCATVSKDSYDRLKSECDADKLYITGQLNEQRAKASGAEAKLTSCTAARDAALAQLSEEKSRNAALQQQADTLSDARAMTGKIDQYALAKAYYDEAYGPGKVPNAARMSKIGAQVAATGDAGLGAAWLSVKNCDSLSGCENAKAAFNSYISARVANLSVEIADFIRQVSD
jgi:uncharacterized protein YceK